MIGYAPHPKPNFRGELNMTTLKETPTEGSVAVRYYQWAFYEYVNNRQSCQWIRDLMCNTLLHCEGYRKTELRKPMKATVADVTRLKTK